MFPLETLPKKVRGHWYIKNEHMDWCIDWKQMHRYSKLEATYSSFNSFNASSEVFEWIKVITSSRAGGVDISRRAWRQRKSSPSFHRGAPVVGYKKTREKEGSDETQRSGLKFDKILGNWNNDVFSQAGELLLQEMGFHRKVVEKALHISIVK